MTSGSDQTRPEPSGARGASLARDVLARAFGQLDTLPAGQAGDQLLAAHDEARIALDQLATAALRDPHYLDHFDAACETLAALARTAEGLDHRGIEGFTRRVTGAAAALKKRREDVLDEMVAVQGTAPPSQRVGTEQTALPFRVCGDIPVVQDIGQGSLGPVTPPRPTPRPDGQPAPPQSDDQLNDLARSCLSEVGRMSRLCHLDGDRPWSSVVVRFEERLLANLDAVLGLCRTDLAAAAPRLEPVLASPDEDQPPEEDDGPATSAEPWPPAPDRVVGHAPAAPAASTVTTALPPLELIGTVDLSTVLADYTGEAPGDADRAFVHSFVLCCLVGEEPVRATVMGLRKAPRATLSSHRRALCLAPNPAIVPEMDKLCLDDDPRLVTLAVDVLRARRAPSVARVGTLIGHPHVEVRCSAAAALAQCSARQAAVELLASQLAVEVDDRVLTALAEALLCLDDHRGLSCVRARLAEERELPGAMARRARHQCLALLALAGDPSDLPTLLDLASRPAELSLLGWHGDPAAIEPLLEVLAEPAAPTTHSREETRPLVAARALERITGATDCDQAPSGPCYRADAVDPNPARWKEWWSDHRDELPRGTKHRHGKPYTVAASIAELMREGVAQDVRQRALLEVSLLSGGLPAPWLDDWSARFNLGLKDLAAHFRQFDGLSSGRLHAPGEWPTRRLGQRHRSVERAGRG